MSERRWSCPECDATFSSADAAAEHAATVCDPDSWPWEPRIGKGLYVPASELAALQDQLERERAQWKEAHRVTADKLAAERKARKAAEAVNAEEVLRRRTNLEARIESLEAEIAAERESATRRLDEQANEIIAEREAKNREYEAKNRYYTDWLAEREAREKWQERADQVRAERSARKQAETERDALRLKRDSTNAYWLDRVEAAEKRCTELEEALRSVGSHIAAGGPVTESDRRTLVSACEAALSTDQGATQ